MYSKFEMTFLLLQLNFLRRRPSQTESFFSLDHPRFEINGLEIEPLFSKWRQTSEFSALNNNDHLLVQVFSCCARVVFIQGGEVRYFSPFWKAWFYFQTIELKPRVVHLKKRVGVGEGGRLAHRVKFSSCYLLSLTSKHWNFLFYDVLQNQRLLQTAKVVRKLPRNLWLRLFVTHFNVEWTGIRTLAEVIK